jgi:hypothetical protein
MGLRGADVNFLVKETVAKENFWLAYFSGFGSWPYTESTMIFSWSLLLRALSHFVSAIQQAFSEWTAESINARQEKLITLAREIWKIEEIEVT